MAVARVVAIIEVMMHFRRANSCLFQLLLKTLFNPRVFLVRLNLLHIQWYAQALREIAFCHGEVPGRSGARVEMLMPPIVRRGNNRTLLPVELYGFGFIQA